MKVPVSLIPENLSPPQPASISRAGSQLSLEQTYDVIRRDRTGFIGSTMAALAASLSAITCVSSNAALKRQQRDQPRGECSIPLRHPPDYPIISECSDVPDPVLPQFAPIAPASYPRPSMVPSSSRVPPRPLEGSSPASQSRRTEAQTSRSSSIRMPRMATGRRTCPTTSWRSECTPPRPSW